MIRKRVLFLLAIVFSCDVVMQVQRKDIVSNNKALNDNGTTSTVRENGGEESANP